MKAHHVTEHLPLWVGGDLSAQEARAVESHLAGCSTCRAAAESLQESRHWLRDGSGHPFSPEERASFRQATLARIRSEAASHPAPRRLSPRSRPWLLAAAALLLAAGSYPLIRPPSPGIPIQSLPPAPRVASPQPLPQAPPTPAANRLRALRPRPLPREPRVGEEPAFAHLELQTSDPSIRIIWLARATPGPALPEPFNP